VTAVDVRVREALTQPDLQPIITPADTTVGSGMWLAPPLTHLAADASYRDDIDRALTMTSRASVSTPRRWRSVRWCCSAFHADIDLRRDPDSGWSFHLKTTA
jgi:hypothetical protein